MTALFWRYRAFRALKASVVVKFGRKRHSGIASLERKLMPYMLKNGDKIVTWAGGLPSSQNKVISVKLHEPRYSHKV